MSETNWSPEEVQEAADVLGQTFQKAFDIYGADLATEEGDYPLVSSVAMDLNVQPALYYMSCFNGLGLNFRRNLAWGIDPRVEISVQRDSDISFEVVEEFGWSSTRRDLSQALAAVVAYKDLIEKTAVAKEILNTGLSRVKRVTRSPMLGKDRTGIFEEMRRRIQLLRGAVQERYGFMREYAQPIQLVFTKVAQSTEPAWKFSPMKTLTRYNEQNDTNLRYAKHVLEQALEEFGWTLKVPVFYFPERNLLEQTPVGQEPQTSTWDPSRMLRMVGKDVVVEPVTK